MTLHANYLRVYDQMIYAWLDGLRVDYGKVENIPIPAKSILRVFATPHRAFSEMKNLLVRKNWIQAEEEKAGNALFNKFSDIPLPFVSITRMAPVVDTTRFNPSKKAHSYYSDTKDKFITFKFPKAYDISYQIDFWMKRKFTEAYIMEWIIDQFGNRGMDGHEILMRANLGDYLGLVNIVVQNTGLSDTSDLEPGDENISLRFTLDLMVKSWFYQAPEEVDYVTSFEFEYATEAKGASSGVIKTDEVKEITEQDLLSDLVLVNNSWLSYSEEKGTFFIGDPTDYVVSNDIVSEGLASYEVKIDYESDAEFSLDIIDNGQSVNNMILSAGNFKKTLTYENEAKVQYIKITGNGFMRINKIVIKKL